MKLIEHAVWILMILAVCGVLGVLFAGQEGAYAEAHAYADAVLDPRFSAAYNDWHYQHPQDKKPGSWDHVHRNDVGDRERWRAVKKAWRELERQMDEAAYR